MSAVKSAVDGVRNWVASKAPFFKEVGFPGARAYQGRFNEEYLPELSGPRWFDVIDKMRKSDALVQAIELVMALPLRSAEWKVVPAGGEQSTGKDQEAADFISQNLFEDMTSSWDDVLRQILLYNLYGFVLVEQIWVVGDDGLIHWKDLKPRKPSTRWRWERNKDTGEYAGWYQYGYAVDKYVSNIFIPAYKTMRFTCREEYGNFDGLSFLRSVYKHWWIRDSVYEKVNVGIERNLLGVPVGKYPANARPEQLQATQDALRLWTTNKGSYLLLPEGFEAEISHGDGTFFDALGYINHHSNMMCSAILADFLTLGHDTVGSYNLSSDKSTMFLNSLNAISKHICDVVNESIKQLCDWNFTGLTGYPKLTCSKITAVNIQQLTQSLYNANNAGMLTSSVDIEKWLRREMGLPAIPDEQLQRRLDEEEEGIYQNDRLSLQKQSMEAQAKQAEKDKESQRKEGGTNEVNQKNKRIV